LLLGWFKKWRTNRLAYWCWTGRYWGNFKIP